MWFWGPVWCYRRAIYKSKHFSLIELSKENTECLFNVVFVWLDLGFFLQPSREITRCTRVAGWRGLRMLFMVQLRRDIFQMLHANLFSFLSVSLSSALSFRVSQVSHTVSSSAPFSSHPPLHHSAPENEKLYGVKYAHSELGVNHHFVFITCSLSSLSRCVSGTGNWGVRKYSCCFWLQSTFFQWALPRGCSSSALVFQPNETLIGSRAVPCMPVNSSDLINH